MDKIKAMAMVFAWVITCIMIPSMVQAQGCMESSSDEGVSVVGYMQAQIDYNLEGAEEGSSFGFNRARVGFIGNVPYDISYYLFAELSPNKADAPYLLDGFITYSRWAPHFKISLGQFKSPFSLELNTPCAALHTINRSKVVGALASPGRDIGMMFLGNYKNLSYSVALMNGTGSRNPDTNKAKDIVGRIVLAANEFLSIGGSARYGKQTPEIVGADEDERSRYGVELQVKHGDFLLQGEYIYGKDVSDVPTWEARPDTIEKSGAFVQAMYKIKPNLQPVIKYETYDPDLDTDNDQEKTITLGLNYFLNEWTRIQINYLYRDEEVEVDNDQLLIQVQVKF
ncbi:MAG: hypothetical protein JXA79_05890 [Deltaproteobacteria bacterium]|nr:hypothetical protein [Deltaproteobacteria bacterium]